MSPTRSTPRGIFGPLPSGLAKTRSRTLKISLPVVWHRTEVEDYAVVILPVEVYEIFNQDIAESRAFLALDSILVGTPTVAIFDVRILAPAAVTLHAGNLVMLSDGVMVEDGAALTLTVGPIAELSCP